MSRFVATITKIENEDHINIVRFDFLGQPLSMMSLDLNENVKVGKEVELTVKPSHIAIAKEFSGIVSYSNQIKAKISSIDNGKLLSSVTLEVGKFSLESIITLSSSLKMNLKENDMVTIFIKATELSILRVL